MTRLNLSGILAIRDRLVAEFPELLEDETALIDMLDGETNAIDAIALLIRRSKEDEASVAGIKALISEYRERAERIGKRAEARLTAAFKLMQALDVRKVERAEFTASIGAGRPAVIVTDESALPEAFVRIERKPDKRAIYEVLKSQRLVPGATLSNAAEKLMVRIK